MTDASGKSRTEPRIDDFSFPEYREPEMTPQRTREIYLAAQVFADRNKSDPFAYGRILSQLKRGLVSPADIGVGVESKSN